MRVCIPTETNEGKNSQVYGHFGSAPYFTICDTDKDSVEVVANNNQHHSHGTCHPMGVLTGKKINAVVCGGMGARAVQLLNDAEIKAYRADASTVEEIIKKLKDKKLEEITVENACAQHGCH